MATTQIRAMVILTYEKISGKCEGMWFKTYRMEDSSVDGKQYCNGLGMRTCSNKWVLCSHEI
jgi:hypothetical protein